MRESRLCGLPRALVLNGAVDGVGPREGAFVNAAFAHSQDFDDTQLSTTAHVSSVVWAALLAAAPPDTDGAAPAEASAAGHRFLHMLSPFVVPRHLRAGWHARPDRTCGLRAQSFGNPFALLAPETETVFFNRVVGLSVLQQPSRTLVHDVADFFREAEARFMVHVPEVAARTELRDRLGEEGLEPQNERITLRRGAEPATPPRTGSPADDPKQPSAFVVVDLAYTYSFCLLDRVTATRRPAQHPDDASHHQQGKHRLLRR